MSNDENEQQHIKLSRQNFHLRFQPNKKGCQGVSNPHWLNDSIGVVGVYPTDIPRCWLGYLPTHRIYDNLLVTDKLLKHN